MEKCQENIFMLYFLGLVKIYILRNMMHKPTFPNPLFTCGE